MRAETGIDIVHIPTFESKTAGGVLMLDRIMNEYERIRYTTAEGQAGLFAAKEALIKATGLPAGAWHSIEISHEPSGKPRATILGDGAPTLSISITHHGEYAVASALCIYE